MREVYKWYHGYRDMLQALPSVTMYTRSHVDRLVRRCVSTGTGRFPVVDMASPRIDQVATVRAAW